MEEVSIPIQPPTAQAGYYTAAALGLVQFVQSLGYMRGAALLCCCQSVAFMVGMPSTCVAATFGFAYGFAYGLPAAILSYNIGCIFPFLISRKLLTRKMTPWILQQPIARKVFATANQNPLSITALLRISPVLPAGFNCYLLGLTQMRVYTYITGSFMGCIPNTVFWVHVGSMLSSAAEVLQGGGTAPWQLIVLGLVSTSLILALVVSVSKKEMKPPTRPTSKNAAG